MCKSGHVYKCGSVGACDVRTWCGWVTDQVSVCGYQWKSDERSSGRFYLFLVSDRIKFISCIFIIHRSSNVRVLQSANSVDRLSAIERGSITRMRGGRLQFLGFYCRLQTGLFAGPRLARRHGTTLRRSQRTTVGIEVG